MPEGAGRGPILLRQGYKLARAVPTRMRGRLSLPVDPCAAVTMTSLSAFPNSRGRPPGRAPT